MVPEPLTLGLVHLKAPLGPFLPPPPSAKIRMMITAAITSTPTITAMTVFREFFGALGTLAQPGSLPGVLPT